MASYTMTIEEMIKNNLTKNIFPEYYEFYNDDEKSRKEFEDKFIRHYYYREIGFETPFMFIQKLETHLLVNMPYWKQLYQTEVECRNINFMLNKDLRETFIREVDAENQTLGTNTSQQNTSSSNSISQNGTSSSTQNASSTTTHQESSIRDGVARASLEDGFLTGVSSDNGNNNSSENGTTNMAGNSKSSDDIKSKGTMTQSGNEKVLEKTDLLSQGNIGITSSAQLLKEWREVLINMDKIIIDSCNDLFMKIY